MGTNANEVLKIAKNAFEKCCDIMAESWNVGAWRSGRYYTTAGKLKLWRRIFSAVCVDTSTGLRIKKGCADDVQKERKKETHKWKLQTPTSQRGRPTSLNKSIKITPWPQSTSELYRPRDRRLSAKLVLTFLRIEGATWSAWRIPTAVFSAF
jgi:hypothetical protein